MVIMERDVGGLLDHEGYKLLECVPSVGIKAGEQLLINCAQLYLRHGHPDDPYVSKMGDTKDEMRAKAVNRGKRRKVLGTVLAPMTDTEDEDEEDEGDEGEEEEKVTEGANSDDTVGSESGSDSEEGGDEEWDGGSSEGEGDDADGDDDDGDTINVDLTDANGDGTCPRPIPQTKSQTQHADTRK